MQPLRAFETFRGLDNFSDADPVPAAALVALREELKVCRANAEDRKKSIAANNAARLAQGPSQAEVAATVNEKKRTLLQATGGDSSRGSSPAPPPPKIQKVAPSPAASADVPVSQLAKSRSTTPAPVVTVKEEQVAVPLSRAPSVLAGKEPGLTVVRTETEIEDTPMVLDDAGDELEEGGLNRIMRVLQSERFAKHSIPTRAPAAGTAVSFALPTKSLVPAQPHTAPPQGTPAHQSQVDIDFTVAATKPANGNQIAWNTFHTWAEAWLRPFGEDDLAFLAPKAGDQFSAVYDVPPIGVNWAVRWEAEDQGLPVPAAPGVDEDDDDAITKKWRPEALTPDEMGADNVHLGPLSERLVAALEFVEDKDLPENWFEGEEGEGNGMYRSGMDSQELEERIKRELRFLGVLDEEDPFFSAKEDNEITSSLRACQRLLRSQTVINEARKSVLASLVRDRIAYQEYEAVRDAQERIIEAGWIRRLKVQKKKGKAAIAASQASGSGSQSQPTVGPQLFTALQKRRRFIETFKDFFHPSSEENGVDGEDSGMANGGAAHDEGTSSSEKGKGKWYGLPDTSVYGEIEPELELLENEIKQTIETGWLHPPLPSEAAVAEPS